MRVPVFEDVKDETEEEKTGEEENEEDKVSEKALAEEWYLFPKADDEKNVSFPFFLDRYSLSLLLKTWAWNWPENAPNSLVM